MIQKLNITVCRLLGCFLVFAGSFTYASKLEKGFEALVIYDYFKAKKLFTEINTSAPNAYASYGLATIYSRHDNPFSNADSAGKYARLSYNLFVAAPRQLAFQGFMIDGTSILTLADSVAAGQLRQLKKQSSVTACNRFLLEHYLADKKIKTEVVYLRDELEFNTVLSLNRSDSTQAFMLTHPQSEFFTEALLLLDRQVYDETTAGNTAKDYVYFIKHFPHNVMVNTAYERLFELYKQSSNVKGLAEFVAAYPQAPQNLEAWKLLFSLSVKSFSNEELTKFLEEQPGFPLKNSILKEMELNSLVLYPYQEGDVMGFVNEQGKPAILPEYDGVTDFYEGLAVVNKNDSVFFINKENVNPFRTGYLEAYVFRHGIAAVKTGKGWCFINRQGQAISRFYDEISDLSDAAYVVRLGAKYGAVDQFAQALVEPRFDKLGDFKNGFAYYTEEGKYGFVSRHGTAHKAELEWISDFDNRGIAVFKQENKYGLIRATGKLLLEAQYEQVLKANAGLFIVVAGGSYGFFSAAGCFLSPVAYEFAKDKPADYYTDGSLLKLLRRGEQALVDENGRQLLPFGVYAELNFFSEGLMRVKKAGKRADKYGYIDRRLNLAIACKYEQAQDFADSVALVRLKDKFMLIDHNGSEVFASEYPVEKISASYYWVKDEARRVIDRQGRAVATGVAAVRMLNPFLLMLRLESGEIKLQYD